MTRRLADRTPSRLLLAAALVLPAPRVLADDKPPVVFSADEVEGDARMGQLVLRGNVVVTYERFRLTSPELALRRTGRGIEVTGTGEVVFCPCPDPPLTIGFDGGIVGPPADLLLRAPRLKIGGITVLGVPWFWMRAPTKPGILPPTFAYRGGDGVFAGGGVHLPWKDGDDLDELDLNAGGYFDGGFELGARVRTAASTSRLRWDHLRSDLVAIDSHGSFQESPSGNVAWDVDAIRGPRARAATLSLDEAARAYDRAEAEVTVRPAPGTILGAGVRALGARGGSGPSTRTVWGPRAAFAFGGALGTMGAFDELLSFTALQDDALGLVNLLRSEGGVEWVGRPGFLVTRLGLRQAITAADDAVASGLDAVGEGRAEIAAPFARAIETGEAPVVHVLEPRVQGALFSARTSGAFWSGTGRPISLVSGAYAVGSGGLRTAWGRLLGHSGASLEADAGAVSAVRGTKLEDAVPVARYRAAWTSRYIAVSADGGARLQGPTGHVVVARARLGEQDGWHLQFRTAGREGVEPLFARLLAAPDAREPSGGWLSEEGWSGGVDVRGSLTESVSVRAAFDEDLSAKKLLLVKGAVGYAHPCRCVAIDAFAQRRLGREGVDVWVSIDLAPR